jgi:lipid-A-disaccharide synthase-like uncharacterized protein
MSNAELSILLLRVAGQTLFLKRFFVQWRYSEPHHRRLILHPFWYFSLGGHFVLLINAIIRKDIVIIAGQASSFLTYPTNFSLVHAARRKKLANG